MNRRGAQSRGKFRPVAELRTLAAVVALLLASPGLLPAALPKPDLVIAEEFRTAGDKPENARSEIAFTSTANEAEVVIQMSHRQVTSVWSLAVNGHTLQAIPRSYGGEVKSYFTLPPGTLRDGQNVLSVVGTAPSKRMSFGQVQLYRQPLRSLLKLRSVTVTVTDADNGRPLPARLTLTDSEGQKAEIFDLRGPAGAVRDGLFYSTGKETQFEVPEGRYEIYATRGMEWSLARATADVSANETARVNLRLRRQVDTTGFVAADTHIHTVTFSGHGDATIEERMLTIAGEGVELAIATDHNHHTDYRPYQEQQSLNDFFTPVTGNEVTTRNGHLNAFPMPIGGALPDSKEDNWVKLVSDMRLKGARVVVLNHPRWPDPTNNPFAKFAFNRATGERPKGTAFTFDAMELVNSSSPSTVDRDDIRANQLNLLADWFAVMNRGEKVTGVGSSDSHTVFNPVGQGRTYLRSSTDDPTRLQVDELCRNFLAGDTTVSYGIFAQATVNHRHRPGEMLRPENGQVTVQLRVAAADWVKPRRAIILLNGLPVAEKKLQPLADQPFEERLEFTIKLPAHDTHLVCGVFGDAITGPYWPTTGKFTAAVVNPLYLDNDGDGKFSSPRETARAILASIGSDLESAWGQLTKADDAIAGQLLGLLYRDRPADFTRQLDARVQAAAKDRALYRTFLADSPLIVVKTTNKASKKKPAKAAAK